MNQEMLDLCGWAIETAKKAGAQDVKATLSRSRLVEVGYRERKAETIKEAVSRNLSIELFVDGRYSSQSSSDLRRPVLADFIARTVATTRLLAEDPFRSLPDPRLYDGRSTADLEIVDPKYAEVTAASRHALVREVEDACLAAGGAKVVSASASSRDNLSESAVMTSNGLSGYEEATRFTVGAQMTAQDEGDRRPNGYHYVEVRRRGLLPDAQGVGRTAAERTLALLGAKKIPTATLPIIIENRGAGRVLSGFLSGMFGGNIQQKRSFLADKLGQKIGSSVFTLVDDPLLVGGLASRPYDGDGFAARRRVLVGQGVLKDFFIDWYYSRKLGWAPTTGGPSNLLLPPGSRSVEAIMKDLGRGIVVSDFIGGNSNATTGDTSVGIIGHLFENGVPTQPVAEMNIADNHLKLWNKLSEAANDPWLYGSWRIPSLVFSDVVVSGV
jgi:PmbA protein